MRELRQRPHRAKLFCALMPQQLLASADVLELLAEQDYVSRVQLVVGQRRPREVSFDRSYGALSAPLGKCLFQRLRLGSEGAGTRSVSLRRLNLA